METLKKNVYALIVGINEYQRSPLRGCVKDSLEIGKLLSNDLFPDNYQFHIKYLHNEAATRMNIISHWENHLRKAQKGDVALFYFSGHGTQEEADPTIWQEEGDAKLEGLVCYDSLKTNLFLADKELRFLIHEVAKNDPHILTIFDCCHSGENTRAYEETDTTKKELAYSKMSNKFPARKWEDFYFHDKVDIELLKDPSVDLNKVLPQGNHIQLAACQSNQSAYETTIKDWGKGGIFTYTLIDILKRSKGVVTYYDLKSRIHQYIKNRYRQSPTIYVKGNSSREIYKTFLGGEQHSQPLYGNVIYNKKREAWILDLGAIHGISKQAEAVTIKVNEKEVVGKIVKVHASDTEIAPVTDLPKGAYQAFISSFKSAPIAVFLNGTSDDQTTLYTLQKSIEEKGTNINLVSDETQADYTIQFAKPFVSITLPFDPSRPLVLPIEATNPKAAEITFDYLYHISKWEFIKLLHNTDNTSQLDSDALKIEFFDTDNEEIPLKDEQIIRKVTSPEEEGAMRIRLTNVSPKTVHVAVLYLGSNFEAYPNLLETKVQVLNRNDFVWLGAADGDGSIPYQLDTSRHVFNWKENTTYFKFIISTKPFAIDNLELSSLPDPTDLIAASKAVTRGIKVKATSPKSEKWTTRLIAFTIPNPCYQLVEEETENTNLQKDVAVFSAAHYLAEEIEM